MTIFDTHAHYDDPRFDGDRHQLIKSLPEQGVCNIINIGCSEESSRVSVELAEKYDFCYAAVGVHPHDSGKVSADYLGNIGAMSKHPKVVAIGEIGLDYHYDFSPRDVQKVRFFEQLQLAHQLKMPVIIHEREAVSDCLDIIRCYKDVRGVFHCFSGSWETAKEILKMGYYISFTGVLTFKNARKSIEVLEKMPLDRLMVETDAPYMAPEPLRGTRCDSSLIRYTLQKIAEVRGISVEEAGEITAENARRFFGIK